MDYRTCRTNLIYPTDLLDKVDDYRGQTVTFFYADEQKWYYLDKQRTDEVTMIQIWDSKEDVEAKCMPFILSCCPNQSLIQSAVCPHVSFKHPNTPADTPPRESIEVRCFALFD